MKISMIVFGALSMYGACGMSSSAMAACANGCPKIFCNGGECRPLRKEDDTVSFTVKNMKKSDFDKLISSLAAENKKQ